MIDESQFNQSVQLVHQLAENQQYEEAAQIQKSLCQQAEQLYGVQDPIVAWSYKSLGNFFRMSGQLKEAEKAAMHGSLMTRLMVGTNDPLYASDLINIGWVFRDKKEFSDARDLFHEAIRILKFNDSIETPDGINALFSLAICCVLLGSHAEADQARTDAKVLFHKCPEHVTAYFSGLIDLARANNEAGLPTKFISLMEEFNIEAPPQLLRLAQK